MPVTLDTWTEVKLEPAEFPQRALIDAAMLGPSLTLAAGTVLGKRTSDNKLYAYNDALTNGVEVAVAILVYPVATDASGNHYLGTSASPSRMNLPSRDTSIYIAGVFREADLTGWNAAALADFKARLLPSGFIYIP